MATLSKWKIYYSTRKFCESGDKEDLSYDIMTSEGLRCKFKPTTNGLHIYEVSPDDVPNVFGTRIIDNLTDGGDDICHVDYGNSNSNDDQV